MNRYSTHMKIAAILVCAVTTVASAQSVAIPRVPAGSITLDADFSDWPTPNWTALDYPYYGTAGDVAEAEFAVVWARNDDANGLDGKLYIAVVVDDSDHVFTDAYSLWDAHDGLEIYTQGQGGLGGVFLPGNVVAQQWTTGVMDSDLGSAWTSLADRGYTPSAGDFDVAVGVNGSVISYEIAVSVYDLYGQYTGQDPTVATDMTTGTLIGFDVIAGTRQSGGSFAMLSANDMVGKSANALQFALYSLGGTGVAGDFSQDFNIDLLDFALFVGNWQQCIVPDEAGCDQPWQ